MFVIYRQKTETARELLEKANNGAHAYFLMKRHSLRFADPILCVETLHDGTTLECCRFKNGRLIWAAHPNTKAQERCCSPDGSYHGGELGFSVARKTAEAR